MNQHHVFIVIDQRILDKIADPVQTKRIVAEIINDQKLGMNEKYIALASRELFLEKPSIERELCDLSFATSLPFSPYTRHRGPPRGDHQIPVDLERNYLVVSGGFSFKTYRRKSRSFVSGATKSLATVNAAVNKMHDVASFMRSAYQLSIDADSRGEKTHVREPLPGNAGG